MNHCPKCNFDLRGEDIYQYFLKRYSENPSECHETIDSILKAIKDFPSLYENAPNEQELRAMTNIELNAWEAAHSYGWSKEKPKTFKKEIGIEIKGYYDGIVIYQCPNCQFKWKRFKWVDDKYL